ncbi:DEAD/DEAH box helicase [Corynebacterium casei]|uniref:DEAD/DEAH box helicase n=1 Tax=Corynebacterium casei TaxID=160386 RepID=UPI003F9378A5
MKYTLMPYQETASHSIMERLSRAQQSSDQTVFALSAPTGAGKTVIATSVFERLLLPSDDYTPDPKAVILWLSDNPDLNQQSRFRIEGASSDLATRTVEIDNTFNKPTFDPGCIYFLNIQKIGKGTKLTGGTADTNEALVARADTLQVTIWDTIRNTIQSDNHNLYLVVDEAHRGAKKQNKDKVTILRRMIEGHTPEGHAGPVPPMPTVMGISATPGAFKTMINEMSGSRLILDDVEVPVSEVQESGLIKDTIELRIPDEEGASFDGVLVREAARILKESTQRWEDYHQSQDSEGEQVVPLMVVQMRDKATSQDLSQAIDAIYEGWPDIRPDSFAQVFGEHTAIQAGTTMVPYVEPQAVQDRTHIRVLFAKTAVSTGWDCPRAEVMVSYRTAKDKAHITQVIGRMVRSPLARRIEGNAELNSVLCILPNFDRDAADEVVKMINSETGSDSDESDTDPVAVVEPEKLTPFIRTAPPATPPSNEASVSTGTSPQPSTPPTTPPSHVAQGTPAASSVSAEDSSAAGTDTGTGTNTSTGSEPTPQPDRQQQTLVDSAAIWDVFTSLPRLVAPKRTDKPISMLLNLGIELERDGIRVGGKKESEKELVSIVNGYMARYKDQVTAHREDIQKVKTVKLVYTYADRGLEDTDRINLYADQRVIEEAYQKAIPVFTRALTELWINSYLEEHKDDDDLDEDQLIDEARLSIASLSNVAGVKNEICYDANKIATDWLDEARADIAALPDGRKGAYTTLREMAVRPVSELLTRPVNRLVQPGRKTKDKGFEEYPRYAGHILAGSDGLAPMKLNEWEKRVVETEQGRTGSCGWYRNPSRASADAVTAVYQDSAGAWKNMQPDFIFFRVVGDKVMPAIVDPHGEHLSDALDKLRALADYADKFGSQFLEILSLSGTDADSLRLLDLKDPDTRQAIAQADTAKQVYAEKGHAYK